MTGVYASQNGSWSYEPLAESHGSQISLFF